MVQHDCILTHPAMSEFIWLDGKDRPEPFGPSPCMEQVKFFTEMNAFMRDAEAKILRSFSLPPALMVQKGKP